MKRWSLILCLSACAHASPHFRDVPATRVAVDGSVFDVRVRGTLAEAVRVNGQYAPRLGPIRKRAGVAMQQVSGCEIVEVYGDAAVTTGVLGCDRDRAERLIQAAASTPSYGCIEVSGWANEGPGRDYLELECNPN